MANVISKGTLLPEVVTGEMINLVRGKSSLARLSAAAPVSFNGNEIFTFNFDHEIDLVAENGAKSNGGATVNPVHVTPYKVEYGVRVSDEFMYAADEIRLQYLRAFAEGFAAKLARGLDIMAFHGVNPRTGIGQRSDGAILMLVIDGRQVSSLGATFADMTDIFLSYGAVNACNLDGGSSSVMMYRDMQGLYGEPGTVQMINSYSVLQSQPRRMPNYWMVRASSEE